jgi:hypothetical protein
MKNDRIKTGRIKSNTDSAKRLYKASSLYKERFVIKRRKQFHLEI